METTVVNCRFQPYDVYIGRDIGREYHYGNPFTERNADSVYQHAIIVADRDTSIHYFERWLQGLAFTEHEPKRRQWILDNLSWLQGKRLGCFCKPKSCHGDVLVRLVDSLPLKFTVEGTL